MNKYCYPIFCLLIFTTLSFAQSTPAEIEQAIFTELNNVRTNPQSFIPYLEEYKKLFKGKNVDYPNVMILTFEGTKAVNEAIDFLKKSPKLEPFQYSSGLSKPAKLQLTDLMENYSLGHTGKDGSTVPKRVARYGKGGKLAENSMNLFNDPREIIMHLIIDDGLKGRGHRKNIFNKTFKQVGIAFGYGQKNDPISVMVFADSFIETTK